MGGDNPETREPRMAEGGTAGQKKQVDDSETRVKMDDLGKRSQTGTTGGSKSRAMSAIRGGQCGYQGTSESCQYGVGQAEREPGKGGWVVPHGKGRGGG